MKRWLLLFCFLCFGATAGSTNVWEEARTLTLGIRGAGTVLAYTSERFVWYQTNAVYTTNLNVVTTNSKTLRVVDHRFAYSPTNYSLWKSPVDAFRKWTSGIWAHEGTSRVSASDQALLVQVQHDYFKSVFLRPYLVRVYEETNAPVSIMAIEYDPNQVQFPLMWTHADPRVMP